MSEQQNPTGQPESQAPGETNNERLEAEQRVAHEYRKTSRAAEQGCMPRLDFSTFVMSLSSTALVHLGEIPDIQTGQATPDLPLAKQTIDILTMIEGKTRGNLTADEEQLIRDLLFELRVKFVRQNP